MADFRKTEGLVYKEFDREKHVFTDAVYETIDKSVGVDFGYTNPSALLKVERSTENKFYVVQEWYKTGKTTPEIIEVASSMSGNYYYPDPAEPDRIAEMRKAGLNVREVSKDIEAGISTVREMFKSGRLFIHASCKNLILELETYRYPEKKPDKNEREIPIKEMDHAVDALRYVIYMKSKAIGNTAHTHYSEAAMPTQNTPLPAERKKAPIHFSYLGKH
jgi:phage terminase large subunit